MEVDAPSPAGHTIQAEDGRYGIQPSGSEDKNTKRRQSYNRDNVRIEDFLIKNPDDINAKQMRVLLPAMFQKLQYPDKDVSRTKVKGLWDESNRPGDFPGDVPFHDPNNAKKMPLKEMKKMFLYLKNKLLQREDYQSSPAPEKANFQVLSENDDTKQPVDQLTWMDTSETFGDDSTDVLQQNENLYEPYTVRYDNGTELTVLKNVEEVCHAEGDEQVTFGTVTIPGTDNTVQTISEKNNISECQIFVENILATLNQPAAQFKNTFQDNSLVTEAMNSIFYDVVIPLSKDAEAGDKSKCLELSKCCTTLLSIMQRYSFLGQGFDPRNELKSIAEKYCRPVVSEDNIPPVDHEVLIDCVTANQPSFTASNTQPYLGKYEEDKLCTTEKYLENGAELHVSSFNQEQEVAKLNDQYGLLPTEEQQETDDIGDLGIGILDHIESNNGESEYSLYTSNMILGSVSGQQSTLVTAFPNEFGVVAVNPSPGIVQLTDEEQQEITDTILDMEVDYLPTDQKHSIQGQPPDTKITVSNREQIKPTTATVKKLLTSTQVKNPNIPLIVTEVAEMPDEDQLVPKRKHKVTNKGGTSKALGIAGKRQICHRQNKQAK